MSKFTDDLYEEIDRRIDIMESEDYEGVPKFKKTNLIFPAILVVVSLAVLIYAYNVLC